MEIIYTANVVARIFFYGLSWLVPLILLAAPIRLENPVIIRSLSMLPFLVFSVIIGPSYLLESGIFDPYFQYALALDNISLLIGLTISAPTCLVVRSFLRESSRPGHVLSRFTCTPQSLRAVGWIFLVLSTLCFIVLASQTIGILDWIMDPRTGYQHHRSTRGYLFAGLVNFLSVALVLLGISEKPGILWIIILPLGAFLSYLCGSKGVIQNFGAWILTLLFIRGIRLRWYIFVIIGAATAALMLANFYMSDRSLSFSQIAVYFDYYVNTTSVMRLFDEGKLNFFQGEILTSSFWQYVPRALYSEKPYDYGTLKLNEVLWPGLASQGHTPSFGGPIELYSDFGLLGVILGSFASPSALFLPLVMGLGLKVFKEGFGRARYGIFEILAFIILAAPSFLSSLGNLLGFVLLAGIFFTVTLFDLCLHHNPLVFKTRIYNR